MSKWDPLKIKNIYNILYLTDINLLNIFLILNNENIIKVKFVE